MKKIDTSSHVPGLLAAGFVVLALIAAFGGAATAAEAAPDGKALFVAKTCNMCHGVSAAGIAATTKSEKLKGPDLSGFAAKDPAALETFLRLQSEQAGKKHKKEFKGTVAELQAILDWLKEQKVAS